MTWCLHVLGNTSFDLILPNLMSWVAERLGNQASYLKVAGLIPGSEKLCCVLGQGASPYLPRGNVPVLTLSRSG